jgi:predicted TIM-barrel fold metal-dependent hydrolase
MLVGCSGPQARKPVSTIAANDSVTLFDHHVHVLSPALIERWKTVGVPFSKPDYAYSDVDSILKFDPADGMFLVSMAYLYSTPGFTDSAERANVARENDFVAGLARKHPGRLYAFCAVDPLRPWAVDELLRCRRELGMYGLKLHFATSGVSLADSTHLARVRKMFAVASAERMPVMVHLGPTADGAGGAEARLLIDSLLAPSGPVELILAHLGTSGGYTFATKAIVRRFAEALRTRPELREHTIWFDLSAVGLTTASEQAAALTPEDFTDLSADLRELGLERVVFGTDYPAFNSVAYMSTLEEGLPLTREELIGIAGNGLPANFGAGTARNARR